MHLQGKMKYSLMLAGIPFLAFPLLAESGMSRDHSQKSDRQQSLSEEKIVQGEIFRKDGDEITLRDSNGRRISFRINDQTNQLCPGDQTSQKSSQKTSMSGSGSQQSSSGSGNQQSSSMSSMSGSGSSTSSTSGSGNDSKSGMSSQSGQNASGSQNDTQTAGFNFGDCNLQNGDFIKAKVGQDGNATFVRSMGRNQGNYFNAGRAGDDYFVLPAGELGGLDISDKDANYTVKSSNGEEVGHIYRVMTNSNGDMAYAIIRQKDGHMISVPWQALEGSGNKTFKLNVTKSQLGNLPILEEGQNARQHVQKHWDLTQQERQDRDRQAQSSAYNYDENMNDRFPDGSKRYPIQGARPGLAGEEGVVSIFGSPSTLPPSEYAPQYEGADRQGSSRQSRNSNEDQYDRNRQSRYSNDDQDQQSRYSGYDRNRLQQGSNSGYYQDQGSNSGYSQDQGSNSGYYQDRRAMDPLRSPRSQDFSNTRGQGRYNDRNYDNFSDRSRGGRFMESQSRNRNFGNSDSDNSDVYERYQARQSNRHNYDDRPEPYRP